MAWTSEEAVDLWRFSTIFFGGLKTSNMLKKLGFSDGSTLSSCFFNCSLTIVYYGDVCIYICNYMYIYLYIHIFNDKFHMYIYIYVFTIYMYLHTVQFCTIFTKNNFNSWCSGGHGRILLARIVSTKKRSGQHKNQQTQKIDFPSKLSTGGCGWPNKNGLW